MTLARICTYHPSVRRELSVLVMTTPGLMERQSTANTRCNPQGNLDLEFRAQYIPYASITTYHKVSGVIYALTK